ncbi:MAG: 5-formyltetrahydrofolate cyclo-ligase [Alphaproteobacteria bacterium]|nr:5-formyltetrahydrofolate cyclo-ligase [Alphaproteobacteria bacterium]
MKRSKLALREKLKIKREIASKQIGETAPFKIRDLFLNYFKFETPQVIAVYWPINSELNVLPLAEALRQQNHILCLPRIITPNGALEFGVWSESSHLVKGTFGTMTISPDAPKVNPTIWLMPLLGFDRQGHRLGYGKGHYDRTLEKCRKIEDILAIGIGFAAQEVPSVFHETHDERLNFMVTEKEVIKFNENSFLR